MPPRSYYHGRISRDEAVDILTRDGQDGSFLLRMSETQDGVYTISVMCVARLSISIYKPALCGAGC